MRKIKEKIIKCACAFMTCAAMFVYGHEVFPNSGKDMYPTERTLEEVTFPQKEEEVLMVNINTAGIAELSRLSGIGKSKAQAIIGYREENGLFASTEEIMKVPGIKNAVYSKIRDNITVEVRSEEEHGIKDSGS